MDETYVNADTNDFVNRRNQNKYAVNNSFKKDFIYLSLERGKGRKKRGRETSVCGCLSHAPHWGPGPQPRHVP